MFLKHIFYRCGTFVHVIQLCDSVFNISGFVTLLAQLTKVGDVSKEQFVGKLTNSLPYVLGYLVFSEENNFDQQFSINTGGRHILGSHKCHFSGLN